MNKIKLDWGDTNGNECTRNNLQRLCKGTRSSRSQRTSRGHLENSNIKISLNSVISLGDLRKLAVTQTQVKDHQLTFV